MAACTALSVVVGLSACTGATSPLPKTLKAVPADAVLAVAISPNPSDAPIDLHPRGYIAFVGGSANDYMKTPHQGEQHVKLAFGRDGELAFTDKDAVHTFATSMTSRKRDSHSQYGAFGTPYQLDDGSFAYLYNIGFGDSLTSYRYGMEFSGDHPGLTLPWTPAMGVCDGVLTGIRLIPNTADTQYESYRLFTIGADLRTIRYPGPATPFALFRPPQDTQVPCQGGKLYIRRLWNADFPELRKHTPRFNNELTVFDVRTGRAHNIVMKYADGSPVRNGNNGDDITVIHNGRYIWRSFKGEIYATSITDGTTTMIVDTKLRGQQSNVTYTGERIYALDKEGRSSKGELRIYSLDTGRLLQKMPTPALDKAYDKSGDSAITGIAARPDH
jgi:hypothetical protein